MSAERWGVLAQPPRDLITWRRRRLIRYYRKVRVGIRDHSDAVFFQSLAQAARESRQGAFE